jgi:glycerate 2-kinase
LNPRRILLELFDAALRAVDGRRVVEKYLRARNLAGRVAVFAIGKAASSMARGALDVLADSIAQTFVVTKDGHGDPSLALMPRVSIVESAHPMPDERSLAAGDELERRVLALPPELLPVFLISGGSSSLVEALRGGVTYADLRALNERGSTDGMDIARLNAERAQLSRLKGGGIARMLDNRRAIALFISDVPDDDPDVIGSGLLGRDTVHDEIERHIIANVEDAVRAVMDSARAHGLSLDTRRARYAGDAAAVASEFVSALRDCAGDGIVWGGESTVKLPKQHGLGGRNTHLALAAARQFHADEKLLVLAAGTDGTDGPTADAGAIVDSGTVTRAELGGCDVERAFREHDSGRALEASEDLLHTGPTGTNVGDLLIGIKVRHAA